MRKTKRGIFISFLSVVLCISLLAACTNNGTSPQDDSNGNGEGSGEMETVVFALPSFGKVPDDFQAVTDAINKITMEKINVKVDFRLYAVMEYAQKVNLALQSGEAMDLFASVGQFSSYAANGQLYPLDELIDQYAQETKAILDQDFGEGLLKTTTFDGHIYGIPANKGMSVPQNFAYNADMMQELGVTIDDINSIYDLSKVFEALQKKFPDIVPFGPLNGDTGMIRALIGMHEIDMLTDPTGVGVVVGDSGKVVNLYATDIFKDGAALLRDWFNKGYLQKDAASTSITMGDLISSGQGFSFIAAYGGMSADKAISVQTGQNIGMKRIAPFYFDTSAANFIAWAISATSEVPESAMKFLNLVYTDKELINTILYGIEGRDYVKVGEHHVTYPEGQSAATVPYNQQLASGLVGSESIQYQLEEISLDDIELKIRENKETKRSPYFGFIFDPSSVKTELSAVMSVVLQYLPGINTGTLDPEKAIPEFLNALNNAGAEKIIQEKQKQLDQWIAENK